MCEKHQCYVITLEVICLSLCGGGAHIHGKGTLEL
jgi:hypothetical protein